MLSRWSAATSSGHVVRATCDTGDAQAPVSRAMATATGHPPDGTSRVTATSVTRPIPYASEVTTRTLRADPRSAARPRSGPDAAWPTVSAPPTTPTAAYEPAHPAIRNETPIGSAVTL